MVLNPALHPTPPKPTDDDDLVALDAELLSMLPPSRSTVSTQTDPNLLMPGRTPRHSLSFWWSLVATSRVCSDLVQC